MAAEDSSSNTRLEQAARFLEMANNLLLNPPSTSLSQVPSTAQPLASTPATSRCLTSSSSPMSCSSNLCTPSLFSPSTVHTASALQSASLLHTGTPVNMHTGPALSRLFQPYVNIRSSRARHRLGPSAWEHEFYCMASPSCNNLPTPEENSILKLSGLGEKKVRFEDMNGSFADFTKKIGEVFPALKRAGPFKIMRTARGRQLVDIPMPPEGYSIPYLRLESGLNKAVAYIVPIQNSIPLVRQEDTAENVVMERCNICCCEVPLHRLQEHVNLCSNRSSAQGDANGGKATNDRCPAFKIRVALLLDHSMATFNSNFATEMKRIDIACDMPEADLKDLLWKTFPGLNHRDFDFCRVDRFRRVLALSSNTLSSVSIRKELGRSALYIRPKKPLELSEDSVSSNTSVGDISSEGSEEKENLQVDPEEEEDIIPVGDNVSEEEDDIFPVVVFASEEEGLESVQVDPEEEEGLESVQVEPEEEEGLESVQVDPEEEGLESVQVDPEEEEGLESVQVINESYILPQGHHAGGETESIEERRRLIQEQNSAYEESLLFDQQRLENERRRERIEERRLQVISERRELAASFPSEGGITFQFHYPDGSRTRRDFQLHNNIQNLICYAGAVGSATEFLCLRSHNPDLAIRTSSTGSIADYITQSTTFFVQWVGPEQESYDDVTPAGVISAEATAAVPPASTVPSGLLQTSTANYVMSASTSTTATDTSHDLRGLLLDLQSAAELAEPGPTSNCVNVVRSNVLESAMRTFRRRAFNPLKRLDVVFVDTCGTGEGSVDNGGPNREFMRLLMKAVLASQYFVGPQNCKSLALDSLGLSRGTYKVLGMMFSVCLVHGGMGPRVLSRRLYAQLSGLPAPPVDITEVDDTELHDQLDKIQRAETVEEARTAMVEASNSLHMLGALGRVSTLQERDDLVQAALTYYVEGRMEMPLKQLKEGLETLGVLNALEEHSSILEELFCGGAPTLSAATLLDLFKIEYSQRGSSRRALEEVAIGYWRDWIIQVEDGDAAVEVEGGGKIDITLEDVLVFASGASAIPAFGFGENPTIKFLHEELNGNRRMFPEANTCAITLKLPIGHKYEDFCNFMTTGIIQSPVFGVA